MPMRVCYPTECLMRFVTDSSTLEHTLSTHTSKADGVTRDFQYIMLPYDITKDIPYNLFEGVINLFLPTGQCTMRGEQCPVMPGPCGGLRRCVLCGYSIHILYTHTHTHTQQTHRFSDIH